VGRRLILDTCVLVDVDRGRLDLADHIRDDDDAVIAAITAAELWEGYVRAADTRRRARRAFVEAVLDRIPNGRSKSAGSRVPRVGLEPTLYGF
jgi:tRNA(fMet)-specific endonuclease VapC